MTTTVEQLNKCNARIITYKDEPFTDCIWYVTQKPTTRELRSISRKQFSYEYVNDYVEMMDTHKCNEWYFNDDETQILLESYDSLVAMYIPVDEVMILFPAWKYSTTTVQHVAKFMKAMHFPACCIEDYLENDHVIFATHYRIGAFMRAKGYKSLRVSADVQTAVACAWVDAVEQQMDGDDYVHHMAYDVCFDEVTDTNEGADE